MSEEEFRRTLNLRINVFQAQRQHLGRVTQLINKTNQFNLTTIRRGHDEVEALANSADAVVLGMDIQDRYGDYGLVGVSILKKEARRCIIDTLLMSCRVLGRGAEEALIAAIVEAAAGLECDELRGKYIPTPKNSMVKDLYERFDFAYDARSGDWLRSINRSIPESSTLQGRSAVAD
jgi:FkbH-like protein